MDRIGPKEDCCIGPIPFWWFFTPFYATCLLKFLIFLGTAHCRDLKPVPLDLAHLETLNMHHSSNLMHLPKSKKLWKHLIFLELLKINKMWFWLFAWILPWPKMKKNINVGQGNSHVQKGLKICTYRFLGMLITFSMLCVTSTSYDGFSELPLTKNEKKTSICTGKSVWKAWISAHIGFWLCWLQCTMLELCVTSMFWMMVFSWFFWQESLGIGFRNMVYG